MASKLFADFLRWRNGPEKPRQPNHGEQLQRPAWRAPQPGVEGGALLPDPNRFDDPKKRLPSFGWWAHILVFPLYLWALIQLGWMGFVHGTLETWQLWLLGVGGLLVGRWIYLQTVRRVDPYRKGRILMVLGSLTTVLALVRAISTGQWW